MKFRFLTCFFAAFLLLNGLDLKAQGFAVVIDSALGQPGNIVCLPVRAHGFNDILSFQYSLSWNREVLSFDHTQNYNLPGWMPTDFGANTPGILLVGWADPDGLPQTRAEGAILYEACFMVIGPLGAGTDITPGSAGFPPTSGGAEAYNQDFTDVWTPSLNVPGFIEISSASGTSSVGNTGEASFQLSPNPTIASATVSLKSISSGSATLSVTNALGQVVFEQKIMLKKGENTYEIPARVLNAKGMYQVSLQSDKGVFSQMLSVN